MSGSEYVTHFPEVREPLLNLKGAPGKNKRVLPAPFDPAGAADLPGTGGLPDLPDVSEVETVRHFTRLSRLNYGIDHGMYPLGSCTMKYNPKITEEIAARLAPVHPADTGAMGPVLERLAQLQDYLGEICGMDACSLWPAAGAHGELTGMMVIKRALKSRGEHRRTVLIPDTAHGTNPASCTIAGFVTKAIPSGENGYLEASILRQHLNHDTAALMITNPNTLGVFEQEIHTIAELLHENGSYLYMDGANLNAIMGIVRPGDMGVDCMHVNLHKTFGTPHGGGGPGSGPVLVRKELEPFLPAPRIVRDASGAYVLEEEPHPESIGKVHSCMGNVSVCIKALAYILSLGHLGLREAATTASLNALYIKNRLKKFFDLAYDTPTLHEFVFSDALQKEAGVTTMDMAKALMDFGFHPPTVYFPLVVAGALMIEPTETEPLQELDRFVQAMENIAAMSREEPEKTHESPLAAPVLRVDEVWAARNLILTWPDERIQPGEEGI
ncbi:MAG: aminomethyl-transferring glycine dehydrogenase subunit GcvPB [Desulfomonilia bacterium]|uniref:glycine dehydrogenase (aminomethyl-transferring) n=1 Tax=anaerobic digester metagenome TaxID=1263854 RepID=A0A485M5B4_9ZZZZ|nr:aminomethyl-transferring glycine dehydrogenase subunit GcvPB [Pseudomonadota bacterium]HPD20822.1 aminomethyl-transferring glycine dehydrogenase subunit GcvPB [Deltaproteobacteria bacterium]HPX18361.1 aminomethyl-transferring glycine dehydrogenase subunit GcvPB [Deltaproteobacteria bacterium]HRS55703.1 aminomethyl-transferring glycine dehydrogenase subunit GcvPB [Desulfomonilia bacterium]HRV35426.1 aminomethyl-transferring glycine dehydrogenase subunit GcvPB [Desulfomonilia bacterium]